MNNTTRFDGKGEIYAKARPKYAAQLFEYIKNTLHIREDGVFADIGSGTGIFSEQLLDFGYSVCAVEPNGDMRKKAEEKLSARAGFTSVNGTDANTTLLEHSVDCITTAQAFHWFDAEAFRKECRRILKPHGKVIIVYNSRDEGAECNKALAALHQRYSKEFHGFSNGISDEKCRSFYENGCEVFRADNSVSYDRQGYINRVLSSSYSLREGDVRYAEYLSDINKIFEKFAVNEVLAVPMHTVAYIGEV